MIVELVDHSAETVGTFQSPAIPRRGEQVSYADERYVVEEITWFVETKHDQNIERVRVLVSRPGE